MSSACYLCGHGGLDALLDVAAHPISNRFLRAASDESPSFPLSLSQCDRCGLVQTPAPVAARELVPPYDWITYSEPEGHLDGMVETLAAVPGVRPAATVGGVSFKDDSTLARFERLGFPTWRLDLGADLGVVEPRPGLGVETIQDRLTPGAADEVVRRHGTADLLIVRHIFEHAHAPRQFLEALARLVKPSGYLVLEVPDCTRAFEGGDYTTVWEEHTMYFTPATLRFGLQLNGFTLERFDVHPYPFESSLVATVTRAGSSPVSWPVDGCVAGELGRAHAFAAEFPGRRARVRAALESHQRRGRIAIFGAGHLAVTYLTLFGVADLVDCVIDDNPNKRGLYMPGSRLPIVGSAALLERNIALCLLGLNPLGEQAVQERHAAFVERGGAFASIFPASACALAV